jgi:hypothetical protein
MKKSSNRRVLGDIGNIVGALNTKCVVRKQAAEAVYAHIYILFLLIISFEKKYFPGF